MHVTKRQGYYGTVEQDMNTGFYYKEWIIFIGVLILVFGTITLIRLAGRKRIRQNLPLLWYQRFFFPRTLRNGPPYNIATEVPLTYAGTRYGAQSGIMPPPPSYDPYATNLPAYQAKHADVVGTSEVPPNHAAATTDTTTTTHDIAADGRYQYTIPESIARR